MYDAFVSSISELVLLFASALLAATVIPGQSEVVLAGLLHMGSHSPALLVAVASVGNILGACVSWWLGRYLEHFKDRRWFPCSEKSLEKASRFYQRYGVWSLLFAWLPFIGDAFTVVAGLFRTRFWLFLLLVTPGKVARYAVVVALLA